MAAREKGRQRQRQRSTERKRDRGESIQILFFVHLQNMFYTCPFPKPECPGYSPTSARKRRERGREGRATTPNTHTTRVTASNGSQTLRTLFFVHPRDYVLHLPFFKAKQPSYRRELFFFVSWDALVLREIGRRLPTRMHVDAAAIPARA
jgi:hypothetical protein